jgi:glycosyltransferase involved in cell wall biosynthesis
MPKSILYLTYDGLTDPLGQSQILPYLEGLAGLGHEITVISFEKKQGSELRAQGSGLNVVQLSYHKSPPVLSTLYDIFLLRREVKKVLKTQQIQIIHCRSYITSLVGLWAKRKYGVKFIFDMRGFWADERVEGGLWNLSSPIFRLIYGYFKKKEKQFLREADSVISLTRNAKTEIEQNILPSGQINKSTNQQINIQVIPTCADLDHFDPGRVDKKRLPQIREDLGIRPGDFVLLYLGSLGTWYMLDEMLDFYDILRTKIGSSRLLLVSPDQHVLKVALTTRHYKPGEIIITSSSRAEVPLYISIASSSIFFIKPTFSKKASSATKMGEIMSMGKPVITNTGWGDVDEILSKILAGILVRGFTIEAYEQSAESLLALKIKPEVIRNFAEQYFSLNKGVAAYDRLYRSI